jgi:hypothetical protein
MVVEHSFVTTMEAAEAFRVAGEFLTSRGFRVTDGPRAHESDGARCEVMGFKCGGTAGSRGSRVADLPQSVWVEYDRGRVVVGASALAYAPHLLTQPRTEVAPTSELGKPFVSLLFMTVLSIEALLCPGARQERPVLAGHWEMLEESFVRQRKAFRRGELRKLAIVGAFIAAFLALMVASATSVSRAHQPKYRPPVMPYGAGR